MSWIYEIFSSGRLLRKLTYASDPMKNGTIDLVVILVVILVIVVIWNFASTRRGKK